MTAPLLELRQIGCVRGGRTLFTGLSCRVAAGSLLRVAGDNGAGKTSLLRMICGLVAPSHGQVLWRNRPVHTWQEDFYRQLVYVGHAAALKDDLSAVENLQASLSLAGQRVCLGQAVDALTQTGLLGRLDVPTRLLSQGQRKRVALARLVLGAAAPLWVLDEPLNALDSAAAQWLLATVARHVAQGGVVVATSHQPMAWRDVIVPREEVVAL